MAEVTFTPNLKRHVDCPTVQVPGAFEIPAAIGLAAKAAGRFDGFVALGCVIRGETTHYDHICESTADALQRLA